MDEPGSRREAQRRADRLKTFRQELARLEQEGAMELSAGQRERLDRHLDEALAALAGRFDIDTSESQKQISWGMRIASTLGGMALCAAVVLFFLRVWGLMPVWGQVAALFAAPAGMTWAAEAASRRERTPYFTALFGMVAVAGFVLNLAAMGGIFNIASSHMALAPWSAFALLLAYTYRLRLLAAGGLLFGMAFAAYQITAWSGAVLPTPFDRPEIFLITGVAAAALGSSSMARRDPEFAAVYRMTGLLAAYVALLLLSVAGSTSVLPLERQSIEALYQTVGLAAAALVIWAGIRRGWSDVVNLASAFFLLFLYARLFSWWWDWMPKYLFFLLIGLVSILLLAVFDRLRKRIRR